MGLRSPFNVNLEEICEANVIKVFQRNVMIKTPYQCDIAVYQPAKKIYYDFLDKNFRRQDSELCYMDIDLSYLEISGDSFDKVVQAEMK